VRKGGELQIFGAERWVEPWGKKLGEKGGKEYRGGGLRKKERWLK